MTPLQETSTSQTMSLMEKVKTNFKERKWEVIGPGAIGLAALVGTIVFLVSNPFGWTISAGILGAMIAAACINAIAGIGYSIYKLTRDPLPLNNLITNETDKANLESAQQPEIETIVEIKPLPKYLQKDPVAPPSTPRSAPPVPKKRVKKRVRFTQPAAQPASVQPEPTGFRATIKNVTNAILNNPTKSALAFAGLVYAGYHLYNSMNPLGLASILSPYLTYVPLLPAPADVCPIRPSADSPFKTKA